MKTMHSFLSAFLFLISSLAMTAASAQATVIRCNGYNAGSSSEFGLGNNNKLGMLEITVTSANPQAPGLTLKIENGPNRSLVVMPNPASFVYARFWNASVKGTGYYSNLAASINSLQNTGHSVHVNREGDLIIGSFDDGGGIRLRLNSVSTRKVVYPNFSRGVAIYDDGSAILSSYLAGCVYSQN